MTDPAPHTMGNFGPLVIGEEQFKKETETVKKGEALFGPLVLEVERPGMAERVDKPVEHGPLVHDTVPATPAVPVVSPTPELTPNRPHTPVGATDLAAHPPAPAAKVSLSVKDLQTRLEKNPALIDELLALELARSDKRKKALEALYDSEEANQKRPNVLNQIADELDQFEKE